MPGKPDEVPEQTRRVRQPPESAGERARLIKACALAETADLEGVSLLASGLAQAIPACGGRKSVWHWSGAVSAAAGGPSMSAR